MRQPGHTSEADHAAVHGEVAPGVLRHGHRVRLLPGLVDVQGERLGGRAAPGSEAAGDNTEFKLNSNHMRMRAQGLNGD